MMRAGGATWTDGLRCRALSPPRTTMKHTRTIALLTLLLAGPASGCRTWTSQQFVGAREYDLTTRTAPDGARETFRLEAGGGLLVSTEQERQRPFLGFKVAELDKARAERRGVRPYSGLLVTGVYPGSAAAQGGVLDNDVLLAIDGNEIVYANQLAAAEAPLRDGQAVTAAVLRGQERVELPLIVQLLHERVTDRESIPLDAPPDSSRPFAGVTLRGIPAVWCERIFGAPRNAVVVTGVEVGSPAWVAGVRGGDVIDTVDGEPVPPVEELSRRIASLGEAGQTMRWGVRRGEGERYDAEIALADYSGEAHVGIPLIFHYTNGTYEDRWGVGPFGLVMSNRNHYVADTSTRRVETRNVFSALLGLFRVETGPRETEVRLLWIIRFDT